MTRVLRLALMAAIGSIWALPALADYDAAANYSAAHRGISMVVIVDGEVVFESYPNEGSVDQANPLASGTKSFIGIMAAAAVQDGLFELDDLASDTITEWQADNRASITIRQLLNMTDGLRRAGSFGRPPPYERAAQLPLENEVGAVFDYHSVPLQAFGYLLQQKLNEVGEQGPGDYMNQRIFVPIGLEIGRWRVGSDENPIFSTGIHLTARNWARLGEFVLAGGEWDGRALVDPEAFEEIFQGSENNPAYGLTWWLVRDIDPAYAAATSPLDNATDFWQDLSAFPDDLVMAAGLGDQRLYVSRDRNMVVVRQANGILAALRGRSAEWSDVEFWRLLEAAPGETISEAVTPPPAAAPQYQIPEFDFNAPPPLIVTEEEPVEVSNEESEDLEEVDEEDDFIGPSF